MLNLRRRKKELLFMKMIQNMYYSKGILKKKIHWSLQEQASPI